VWINWFYQEIYFSNWKICFQNININKTFLSNNNWNLNFFIKPYNIWNNQPWNINNLWKTFYFEIDKNSIEFEDKTNWLIYWINDINYTWNTKFWDFILSNDLLISHNEQNQMITIATNLNNSDWVQINKLKFEINSSNTLNWELEIVKDWSSIWNKMKISNNNFISIDNLNYTNYFSSNLKFKYTPEKLEETWIIKIKMIWLEWNIWDYNFNSDTLKQFNEIFNNWPIEIKY
jgi:hypothetical protein